MYVEADVLVVDQGRLACMHSDANPDRLALRPVMTREFALRFRRRPARVDRRLEHHKEGVALRPELAAIPAAKRFSEDGVMLDLRLHVILAQLLHEHRRSFYVGEQEGDCAARQVGHLGGNVRPPAGYRPGSYLVGTDPAVKFTPVPVMAPARSEATKAAIAPTSASVVSRPRVVRFVSQATSSASDIGRPVP